MKRLPLAAILAAFFIFLILEVSVRQSVLLLVGLGMGAALAGARFGFTTGWRQLIEQRNPQGVTGQVLLLALASGVPFNGVFLYVLSAPVFLGEHLHLRPQQFFWFFTVVITGIMAGAWVSGRVAGQRTPKRQIRDGFVIMLCIGALNLLVRADLRGTFAMDGRSRRPPPSRPRWTTTSTRRSPSPSCRR